MSTGRWDSALTPVEGTRAEELRRISAVDELAEDLPGRIVAGLRHPSRSVVLVLDNLHEIVSSRVRSGLPGFVERPPLALSLLVTMRRDPPLPLPRLRLAGLVGGGSRSGPMRRQGSYPLTARERTGLRYLASTLPNAEIAGEFYLSVATVKTHQRSHHRRLGVSGRREAVRRVRHLRLS